MSRARKIFTHRESFWRRRARRLRMLFEQLRQWRDSVYRSLRVGCPAIYRGQLLLAGLLIDEAVGSILLVTRGHAEIAIDALRDEHPRALISALKRRFGEKVREEVVVRTHGNQSLVAKS